VPVVKDALHVVPQLMPLGALVTVPVPVPESVTVSVLDVIEVLNVALTVLLALNVTVHAPIPLHAPDQPTKAEPAAAVGVRVTTVPVLKTALQVDPQLMPLGLLATVPLPLPDATTAS
jgi:hypothetical protein